MAQILRGVLKIIEESLKNGIDDAFKEAYSKNMFVGYRLEQCGKQWRVMHYQSSDKEPKTDWMTYEEAEALRKLFEAST